MTLVVLIYTAALLGSPQITVDQIKADYSLFFSAEMQVLEGGRSVAEEYGVKQLPLEHPIAELLNSHPRFFDYLLQNGHGITFETRKLLWSDSSSYGSKLIGFLQDDSTFSAHFLPVVKSFLDSRGVDLIGYQERPVGYSVPIEDIMKVAVRFFYPDAVVDGEIVSHVCIGINGVQDIEGGRDILVEAFAYASILKNLDRQQYRLRAQWREAAGLMNSLSLSTEEDTRLARAQGVMWGQLFESEGLRQMLLDEQRKNSEWLPFRVGR